MSKNKKTIWLYIILTFILTWTFELLVVCPRYAGMFSSDTAEKATATVLVSACMFIPALCALLTRLVLRDWDDCRLRLSMTGHVKYYVLGWVGPLALTVIGAALWFVLNPEEFVLTTPMSVLHLPTAVCWLVFLVTLLAAPLLNLVACFGEEWGWRGFLMPRLCREHTFNVSALLTGLLWGLWHAPIIAMGHNYRVIWGEDPVGKVIAAIAAMIVFCVVASFFFGYLSEKAKSVWPAALAHGCMNGVAGLGYMFSAAMADSAANLPYNTFVGPAPMGIVGGFAFVIVAVWIAMKMWNRKVQ